MKMRFLLFCVLLVFMFSGIASAGTMVPQSVTVPTFTPWGAILGAAVLGVSGLYTLLKKK